MSFSNLPHQPSISVKPVSIDIPQASIDKLHRQLRDSDPIPKTYETLGVPDHDVGITSDWMNKAIDEWSKFDWNRWQSRFNQFPQFKAQVPFGDGDREIGVHFFALFSERKDAQPLIMVHGWPGSFLEFIGILELITTQYTPSTLPYHIIIPALPGFPGLSDKPPRDIDFRNRDAALLLDSLMVGLGFKQYIAQGGDMAGYIVRFMAKRPECKAIHVNFWECKPPVDDNDTYDALDRQAIELFQYRVKWDFAYMQEHATRPSTIAIVVNSSPVALLAWIGEKMLSWADKSTSPTLDTILANVSLYYHFSAYPTSIYHYRASYGHSTTPEDHPGDCLKPVGYSHFIHELIPTPIGWLTKVDGQPKNLVCTNRHEQGGHYAALEVPETLWADVEAFVRALKAL